MRVLKTEDVGYIPAENIETPYERLARLNKHRNVDLAAATQQEKQAGEVQGRERLKGLIAGKGKSLRSRSGEAEEAIPRRVIFAPPTYVEHPGVTWSSDEETSDDDEDVDDAMGDQADDETETGFENDDVEHSLETTHVSVVDMEPDDGVEWADGAIEAEQQRLLAAKGTAAAPANGSPVSPKDLFTAGTIRQSGSNNSLGSNASSNYDPAEAGETRHISVTPMVAQAQQQNGVLLPSAHAGTAGSRNVSGQSVSSIQSNMSTVSSVRSNSPSEEGKKIKKQKKSGKEDDTGEKRRSKGMLGGLFSRGKDKSKKGVSSSDPRTSEDSIVSGPADSSPGSQTHSLQEQPRAPTPGANVPAGSTQPLNSSNHGYRLQQRDQALQQAYTEKYLRSPTVDSSRSTNPDSAQNVAQSAAALRMASMSQSLGGKQRPGSIILSPNPAGPPLLNVVRVFAGDHIQPDATFKTVLLNETTSSNDLIRQLIQRFGLSVVHADTADAGYYLTIKDVSGEEMELGPDEKPLVAFQDAVQRWASDEEEPDDFLRSMTPTIKRSSVSSISSVASLSNHPAIKKLGMNDFQDDSTVKIFIHCRTPPDQRDSQTSQNPSATLTAVQERTPETQSVDQFADASPSTPGGLHPRDDPGTSGASTVPPQRKYNPSLTVSTGGQASPERFSSPSARFTVQVVIHPDDLPDGSAFDPASDAIVSRQMARDRPGQGSFAMDVRKRLFQIPRNATVLEAIEQGLERFGIQEGVVDGGDDIEDRGNTRSSGRVRYSLSALVEGNGEFPERLQSSLWLTAERSLTPSGKILDAYSSLPQLRPVDRMSVQQRRRSRDMSQTTGAEEDILPTDPIFVLRRVHHRHSATPPQALRRLPDQQSASPSSPSSPKFQRNAAQAALSPAEIIAAQRAASRANQKALISAHSNTSKGVDVVLPDRGTLRSSRLTDDNGEVVRYSFIEQNGETYDISDLLAEEWNKEELKPAKEDSTPVPPTLQRMATDSSSYVTAPSTPDEGVVALPNDGKRMSQDILQDVIERHGGKPDGQVEERLKRVVDRIKSDSARATPVDASNAEPETNGRTTPQPRHTRDISEDVSADRTPRASQNEQFYSAAADVNRIVSRHRQQPSIASIMSDLSASPAPDSSMASSDSPDRSIRTGVSTPMTSNSASHRTPPYSSASVFVRSVNSVSPTPSSPVNYIDDFGIKSMMAMVDLRTRETKPRKPIVVADLDDVQRSLYGDQVEWEQVHPMVKTCFTGVAHKLDIFDQEIDGLLAAVLSPRKGGAEE